MYAYKAGKSRELRPVSLTEQVQGQLSFQDLASKSHDIQIPIINFRMNMMRTVTSQLVFFTVSPVFCTHQWEEQLSPIQ